MTRGPIIVFAGGAPLDDATASRVVGLGDEVIAADSGADRATEIGMTVDVVVGDLDSISPSLLADLDADPEVEIRRHAAAKDETDLELALLAAVARGPERIVVTGLDGGRPDHHLANLLLLADPRFASVRIDAELAGATVRVVHDRADLDAATGDLVSLLPVGGPALGVVTEGLRYPLRSEDLPPGSPRGVSNVAERDTPAVAIAGGTLLAVVVRP